MKAIPRHSSLVAFRHRQWLGTEGVDWGQGFTFIELLVVLGVVAVLALLALPALANGKAGSQRAVCANNLARIGRAQATWGSERGDLLPWQVLSDFGGTRNHPSGLNNNIWFQFAWVSNELATPRILACPSDRLAKVADKFGLQTNGLLHPGNQNNSISYTLSHPYPEYGRLVLSSDRNAGFDGGLGGGCFSGMTVYTSIHGSNSFWMDFIHVKSGNLLFNDGSVEQADNDGLRGAMSRYDGISTVADRHSQAHFLTPRPPGIVLEREN